ncbi:D-Ala-D-Ala carboxypeptidase family metallohydrolase [Photobacterium minamisatsumaniensis]|uniref:D-Ala-D-Ala carboxypeptidase family metallohydrolase n=1 Tax=Photobacterium minamisatsumaniensis TaxID=2910233 RepID=UPI003D0EEC3C
MKYFLAILCLIATTTANAVPYSSLYKSHREFNYDDLVIEVQGYKVPTRAAFRGWVLMNHNEDIIAEAYNYFIEQGVKETMPLHLVLLQGTDWRVSNTTIFNLPKRTNWDNMIRTLLFIQKHVSPKTGLLIPVSGDRSKEYNIHAGGAPRSSHLDFCALDLVPIDNISRPELHKILQEIYRTVGKKNKMGLGLYSGVRFHIDTCGHRQW